MNPFLLEGYTAFPTKFCVVYIDMINIVHYPHALFSVKECNKMHGLHNSEEVDGNARWKGSEGLVTYLLSYRNALSHDMLESN